MLQLARYSTEGLLQLGPLGSTTFLPDTKCLIDDGRGRTPSLKKCDAVSRISQRLWDFTQVKTKHMTCRSYDEFQHYDTLNVRYYKTKEHKVCYRNSSVIFAVTAGIRIYKFLCKRALNISSPQSYCVLYFSCRMVQSSAGTLVDAWR